MRPSTSQLARWWVFVLHSPLFGFWLLLILATVTAVVRSVLHPDEFAQWMQIVAMPVAMTMMVARHKGISPWPPALWEEERPEAK